jgi:hypothetical protein
MLRLFVFGVLMITTTSAFAETNEKSATFSILIATITAAFGFLGSWLGANFALDSFKRQRAFDKQLDWYERAGRSIFGLAEKLQIAVTHHSGSDTDAQLLKESLKDVHREHLKIGRVAQESRLFASVQATTQMDQITERVQKIANETEVFDVPAVEDEKSRERHLKKMTALADFLEQSALPLLAEGRNHLGIDRKPSFMTYFRQP